MFGEGSSGNALFPASLEGNRFQYDVSALPQLQLFGDVTVGCSGYPISHTVNEHPSAALRPTKRVRDVEPNYSQQKLQISLNNNFGQNEVDQAGSILNPITVSTGLRLSYEEKERNSSVTSAPENMKAALPARLPIDSDSGFKYEIDRQREEFDYYIKVQEDNMMKGMRELVHRQTVSLLNSLQKEVSRKLYQKDLEIDNLNRKNRELGERIKQITVEAQSWHYRAKYNESVVNALKSNIQQAMAHGSMQAKEGCGDSEVNDAASSTNHHLASGSQDQIPNIQQLKCCRACKSKEASVLLVPCRHLCLCIECEGFIDSCPVCQSTAISFSPSISLPKKPHKPTGSASLCRFNPLSQPFRFGSLNGSAARKINPIRCSADSSSSNLNRKGWISVPPPAPERESDGMEVRATSVPESAGEAPKSKSMADTLVLGSLFGLWYLFNIYFNIYNKQVLKAFHYPVTVTLAQFAVGSVLVILMWTLNLYKRPKISGAQLVAILPLAVVHTLGNLFTNMSLGKVAVSFTHTIKAMEPFFSVVLSAMFLGEFPTLWVLSSLVPIVGGVGLASMTEASFNWAGFWSAMASNLTNQSRNVLSKKFMVRKEDSLDNITLFSIITIMSFFLLAPYAFFTEGVKFTPAYLEAAGMNVNELYMRSLIAALCFHAYQQVSYMILQRVSPVTHSVGNCVKRVVVIVTSVLFFRTPVSPINGLGTGIALAGVFLYSRVKRIKPKAKTE